jgi:hypothetical protein
MLGNLRFKKYLMKAVAGLSRGQTDCGLEGDVM